MPLPGINDRLQALQWARRTTVRPIEIPRVDKGDIGMDRETMERKIADTLEKQKEQERVALEQFIETGTSSTLGKEASESGSLIVFGNDFGKGHTIFIIKKGKLYVDTSRSSHLKSTIIDLVVAENLKLEIVEPSKYPSITGRMRRVEYWPWSHRKEVDDRRLLEKNALQISDATVITAPKALTHNSPYYDFVQYAESSYFV